MAQRNHHDARREPKVAIRSQGRSTNRSNPVTHSSAHQSPGATRPTNVRDNGGRELELDFRTDCAEPSRSSHSSVAFAVNCSV
jgi:hypothetical protein